MTASTLLRRCLRTTDFRIARSTARVAGALTALLATAPILEAPLNAQPTPPRATIVEELRLDPEKEDFGRMGTPKVGPRGQMVIPDYSDLSYRVYDAAGKQIGRFGRRGSGPGEWPSINPYGWVGDTIFVSTPSLLRMSYFSSSGMHLRTVSNPSAANMKIIGPATGRVMFVQVSQVLNDGSLAGLVSYIPARGPMPKDSLVRVYASVNAAGEVRVLLPRPPVNSDQYYITVDGVQLPIPFLAQPQRAFSQNFDYMAQMVQTQTSAAGGNINVVLTRTGRDTLYTRTFQYRGEPIPPTVRDSVIGVELTRAKPEVRERMRTSVNQKTPRIYSGSQHMILGLDETVWVSLQPNKDGHRYLVLNRKGEIVSSVVLTSNALIVAANAKSIWVVETDEDGQNSIVRYRVNGIPCEAAQCR